MQQRAAALLAALLLGLSASSVLGLTVCQTYVVQVGDTVSTIADKFNLTPQNLEDALTTCVRGYEPGSTFLQPSQRICLPGWKQECQFVADAGGNPACKYYTVQTGDTMDAIGSFFEIPRSDIEAVNPGLTPSSLAVNSFVKLPDWGSDCPEPGNAGSCRIYVATNGDTLSLIATAFSANLVDLQTLNGGLDGATSLQPGQRIKLPPYPDTCAAGVVVAKPSNCKAYVVVEGDTLSMVASMFNTRTEDLVLSNPELAASTVLVPGSQVILPPADSTNCVNPEIVSGVPPPPTPPTRCPPSGAPHPSLPPPAEKPPVVKPPPVEPVEAPTGAPAPDAPVLPPAEGPAPEPAAEPSPAKSETPAPAPAPAAGAAALGSGAVVALLALLGAAALYRCSYTAGILGGAAMAEFQKMQADPNFALEVALGPPCPELVPQQPEAGLKLAGLHTKEPRQFVFKSAHLSAEDFRIFSKEGRLLCVSHHMGKNPYDSLDPLGLSNQLQRDEWKSLTWCTGYHGMPSFKIRPKLLSRHGRQHVVDANGGKVFFSVGNKSRLSTQSLRHNMEACEGEGETEVYALETDLAGRTLQFKNAKGELVAIAQKSTKALILNATLGAGSEMVLDVAAGVDWTAIVACMMAVQQVGAHVAKDAFSNYVAMPLANQAQDQVLQATGLQGVANQLGGLTNQGIHAANKMKQASRLFDQFFKK
ncbi:domain precursor [Micractinium conductrix]|uniref:Domain n=1 Tax=Micractinium conductrix TaxID=554055 RepID=A0A2P6VK04_9CHLO|nr:domain precursor [Micractinium conductrix]|eukprot:PSC74436.1 domain precursor [Micractinium conductrix]